MNACVHACMFACIMYVYEADGVMVVSLAQGLMS